MTFGTVMRDARESADLSIKDLAIEVGMSSRLLFEIESDKRDPTFEAAVKIAKRLDFSLDEFREYVVLPGEG
jgi:transcriptional regulator with XRE-family HTH domain